MNEKQLLCPGCNGRRFFVYSVGGFVRVVCVACGTAGLPKLEGEPDGEHA